MGFCRLIEYSKFWIFNVKKRHSDKYKLVMLTEEPMKQQVVNWLEVEKSRPRLFSVDGKPLGCCSISRVWFYPWIWSCKLGIKCTERPYEHLTEELRHGRRIRKRAGSQDTYGLIPNRGSFEKSPRDIEIFLMSGKNHKAALLVMTDGGILLTRIKKPPNKCSNRGSDAIQCKLRVSIGDLNTLILVNDKASADPYKIEKIGICNGINEAEYSIVKN